ncbi:hypothetical protein, partial [Pseudomonas shirazica]|uniref:hypothetical protein n=1 Tax=Pseudomonas shirazica TaxID=1940636 RepID=UPI00195FB6DC
VGTYQQAQTSSMFYKREDPSALFFDDDDVAKTPLLDRIGNELASHLIVGVEFIPITNFYVRGGYNFQRRHEMKIAERGG